MLPDRVLPEELEAEGERWVSLRDASEAGGVSVSALRKAYRDGRIVARDTLGPYGPQKVVELGAVLAAMGGRRGAQRAPGGPAGGAEAQISAGQALELLDGWRRSLAELAQQLAAEQERAGRAEERESFTRERLEETRAQVAELRAELDGRAGGQVAGRRSWWRR